MAFNKKLLIFYRSFYESAYAITCETKNKGKRHRERCVKGKSFWVKFYVIPFIIDVFINVTDLVFQKRACSDSYITVLKD